MEEELRDSWDMVLGHNRGLLNVNMLAYRFARMLLLMMACLAVGY